jgi:hypothetical protein
MIAVVGVGPLQPELPNDRVTAICNHLDLDPK